MKQEQFFSLLRTVLTLVGALLVSGGVNYFFGKVIDTPLWQEITGVIIAIASIAWSVVTKDVDKEKLMGFIRQVITFGAGILLSKGILNQQTYTAVVAFVVAVLPIILSLGQKSLNQDLVEGKTSPMMLKRSSS